MDKKADSPLEKAGWLLACARVWIPVTSGWNIAVITKNGVVQLAGFVNSSKGKSAPASRRAAWLA